ncbi:MFS transporter [Saccharopolyspora sp. NPDC049357]|uniref:MFS transporter n=1 Tax=Saccharopolyspora sp. NPDC049357 TaxID=3154507 RepID=UPI00341FF4B8
MGVTALLFYSLGSFAGALHQEFGWSRAQISSAFFYTTVSLVIVAAPLGWLLDRYGPRRVAMVSIPGLAISMVLLSQLSGSLTLFAVLFALAGVLGAGTTSAVYTKAVNSKFHAARGLALGIALTGLGVAAMVLPLLVTAVVSSAGWRFGFLTLAGLSLLAFPFVMFGRMDAVPAGDGTPTHELDGMTRSQVFRSRTFWILLFGVLLVGSSVPALIPHMLPMLTDTGLSPGTAATIASVIGVGVILGRLCVGYLLDRFPAPFVATPMFVVAAVGAASLALGGTASAPVSALLLGVCFGAEADLIALLCGNYFGLRAYGFIYGIVYALFTLAVSIGPIWVGALFDSTGSYHRALLIVAAMLTAGAVVFLALPRRPTYGSRAVVSAAISEATTA